jgi:hypothetical protein
LADGLPANACLDDIYDKIKHDALLTSLATAAHKRAQITLRVQRGKNPAAAIAVVRDLIATTAAMSLKVVQSSHSIDIIPLERTKRACIKQAQDSLLAGQSVLTIGDRGAASGNDFDLLTHPFSLSVDAVSTALDSCWNLLPPGISNMSGLLRYGCYIQCRKGRVFTLLLPRRSVP